MYILIILAIIVGIISSINSEYIKTFDSRKLLIMQNLSAGIIGIIMYYNLSNNDANNDLFSYKYFKIWIYTIIAAFIYFIIWDNYYIILNNIGVSKTLSIYQSIKIITVFIISIFILNNANININKIISIGLISLGTYMLYNNKSIF